MGDGTDGKSFNFFSFSNVTCQKILTISDKNPKNYYSGKNCAKNKNILGHYYFDFWSHPVSTYARMKEE